jgi:hypothetical protein
MYKSLGHVLNDGLLRTSGWHRLLALSCYHFIYISYLGLELIFACHSICCGLPLSIEKFSL